MADPAAPTKVATYYVLFAVIAVLTLVTVGVSFSGFDGTTRLILNLLVAGVEASLLAYFFMHLKESDHLIWLVVGASLFWLIILFVLLLNDYVTRHLGVV